MPKDTNIAAQKKFAEGVNSGNFDVFDEVVAHDAAWQRSRTSRKAPEERGEDTWTRR